MLPTAIVSGRKGRLNDLKNTMKNTIDLWDNMLSRYERDIKPSYPEDTYAEITGEIKGKRESARLKIQHEIDSIQNIERNKGFWVESIGLLSVVLGFVLQLIGTVIS